MSGIWLEADRPGLFFLAWAILVLDSDSSLAKSTTSTTNPTTSDTLFFETGLTVDEFCG